MADNVEVIEQIRDQAPSHAEALAQIFESTSINDYGSRNCRPTTVAERLTAVLDATKHAVVPGLQTGITFHDSGFRREFVDPWPSSDNQVGHFLTAVGLSFSPGKVSQSFAGRPLRDWLGAPASMTDEEVAIRLCVGHEKAPDPGLGTAAGGAAVGGGVGAAGGARLGGWVGAAIGGAAGALIGAPAAVLDAFRTQFAAATASDVQVFRSAVRGLGTGSPLDLAAGSAIARGIAVTPTNRGNSHEDLILTIFGWRLGQDIKAAFFRTRSEVAAWIRTNIKAVP